MTLSSSHLTVSALPARILERNYYGQNVHHHHQSLQLEFVRAGGCDDTPELTLVSFVRTSVFQLDQAWPRTCVVWTKLARGEEEEGGNPRYNPAWPTFITQGNISFSR